MFTEKIEMSKIEMADRGCGNCRDLWLERSCLGTADGDACENWIEFTDMKVVVEEDERQKAQEAIEEAEEQ